VARARSSKQPATRRRGRARLLQVLLALVALWLLACVLVVLEPTENKVQRVDAILVLGPPDVDGRTAAAYALAARHYAGTVVVSVESDLQQQGKYACRNLNPTYQVICFQPVPKTTLGEAREIRALAAEHHWNSIIVVTSKYHVSRARLIVQRCLPGKKVLVVASPGTPSAAGWAYQFAYQSAGFVKAFLHGGC
jgi:uncharacterized SAM-binding protein YcdF (DUF218 family)